MASTFWANALAAAYARRTARLDCVVHHLGVALGGRLAASSARRLMVPPSKDTMLRTVRRRAVRPVEHPSVIGIDDWAFRRGQRYGTLVCDLVPMLDEARSLLSRFQAMIRERRRPDLET